MVIAGKQEEKKNNAKEISKDKIKEKFSRLSLHAKRTNPVKKKEKLRSSRASKKE